MLNGKTIPAYLAKPMSQRGQTNFVRVSFSPDAVSAAFDAAGAAGTVALTTRFGHFALCC